MLRFVIQAQHSTALTLKALDCITGISFLTQKGTHKPCICDLSLLGTGWPLQAYVWFGIFVNVYFIFGTNDGQWLASCLLRFCPACETSGIRSIRSRVWSTVTVDGGVVKNKTGDVRITYHWGPLVQPLLLWKTINITCSECVSVALGIQHAKRSRHVILPSVESPVLQNFSTLSHKRHDFRKESTERKIVFWFYQQQTIPIWWQQL